ncbi:glycosyltransferase family 2 protein [Sphingorhabdus pulchriflava]|nr:glycosyltransferase family 2 protein [Sphingorhabdus pulchriflava]
MSDAQFGNRRLDVRISVIIVNWRASAETVAAVSSLSGQSLAPSRIYVVDNGSGDGSLEQMEAALSGQDNVMLLANADNLGFGGGCNRALAEALKDGCDFVWLLNNDARPASDCLAALVAAAAGDPAMGMVGSWLTDPNHPGQDHSGSWMRPWLMSCGSVCTVSDLASHRYSWVTAASVLIRTEALAQVGLFDENFFMYWEDADLSMRIRSAGYRIAIADNAVVVHSAGTSSTGIPVQRYLWHYSSQKLWLRKHHSQPRLAMALLRLKFLAKAVIDGDLRRFAALVRRP